VPDLLDVEAESLADSPSEPNRNKPSGQDENRVVVTGIPQAQEQADPGLLAETLEKAPPEEANDAAALVPQAEMANAETEKGEVLEAEIEALLKNARESIGLQNDPEGLSPVDARALLDRAEDELDQTFREKIMEKLKSGVTRSRTSVANRDR
jgi:hypothetical protein